MPGPGIIDWLFTTVKHVKPERILTKNAVAPRATAADRCACRSIDTAGTIDTGHAGHRGHGRRQLGTAATLGTRSTAAEWWA